MTHISSKFKHFSEPRPSFKMMGGVNINEGKLQAEEGQCRKRYCDPCRKYFTNHASLQRHVKEGVHKEPKISEYPCEEPGCGTTWHYPIKLKRHMISKHDPNKPKRRLNFSCPTCDKKLPTKQSMSRHKATHENRPKKINRKCEICDLPCITPSKLDRHTERAHRKPPVVTECACAKKFKTNLELQTHIEEDHRNAEGKSEKKMPLDGGKDEMVWVSTNGEEITGKKIIQNIEKLKFNLN